VIQDLEKEAGLKDILKQLALGLSVAGGGVAGGKIGAKAGASNQAKKTYTLIESNLLRSKDKGNFVDTKKFLEDFAPGTKHTLPEDYAEKGTQVYKDLESGMYAGYHPELGVIAGKRADPTVLAHEAIGHGSQAKNMTTEEWNKHVLGTKTDLGTFMGKQKDNELDAWTRTIHSGVPLDKGIMDASINNYTMQHKGSQAGGAAGGLGGILSVLGLHGIARRLRKKGHTKLANKYMGYSLPISGANGGSPLAPTGGRSDSIGGGTPIAGICGSPHKGRVLKKALKKMKVAP